MALHRTDVVARHVLSCPVASEAASYPAAQLGYDEASAPKVVYKVDRQIAYIVVNNPKSLNACNFDMYDAIRNSVQAADADPNVRVLILTGAGARGFCAGSDIKNNFVPKDGTTERDSDHLPEIYKCTKPVICAINGQCNGGGLEQALECDIRVSVRAALFGLGETRLGVLPSHGGTQRLPRLIPMGRAFEMLFTGNRIGAEEALRLGLIDHIVGDLDGLLPKCQAIAQQICLSAPLAVQAAKRVVKQGLDVSLTEGLGLEAEEQRKLFMTKDMREGAAAFAQKRAPKWLGQ